MRDQGGPWGSGKMYQYWCWVLLRFVVRKKLKEKSNLIFFEEMGKGERGEIGKQERKKKCKEVGKGAGSDLSIFYISRVSECHVVDACLAARQHMYRSFSYFASNNLHITFLEHNTNNHITTL
jgi:hypothetical protein